MNVTSWILKIVIKNPMQLTIVSAVPLIWASAFCATNVENKGESAITTIPQKCIKTKKTIGGKTVKASGKIKQHAPESDKDRKAILLTP